MNLLRSLLALLVFPGLLYALPMGWLMLALERKLRARFQGRLGPPLSQPFYDVIKLLAKSPAPRVASEAGLLTALPLLAVASLAGALALLPVCAGEGGFVGDLILLVALLEIPPLCLILGGYASRSIYGEVGATREAIVGIACNVPFLAALVAMATAAGSLHLSRIVIAAPWPVRLPALLAILFCLPVKLRLNPFSLANAEQELLAGPLTEFDGPRLALWEVAHGLEWVALTGFAVTLSIPLRSPKVLVNILAFALLSLVLVPLLTILASATARLKIAQATRLIWRWASAVAVLALVVALFLRQGGH
jgi:NADH-quinone oxidoreductase subunit H